MTRTARKSSRLQERLEALSRDISRVEGQIKGVSHAVKTQADPAAARRAGGGGLSGAPLTGRSELSTTTGAMALDERGPVFRAGPAPRGVPVVPDELNAGLLPKPVPDPRFNTYFGTGSLHSVRPLRQERKTVRNRAIFMFVVAVIVFFVVYRTIF